MTCQHGLQSDVALSQPLANMTTPVADDKMTEAPQTEQAVDAHEVRGLIEHHIDNDLVNNFEPNHVPPQLTVIALQHVQGMLQSIQSFGLNDIDDIIAEDNSGEAEITILEDDAIEKMSIEERRARLKLVMQAAVDVMKSAVASKELERDSKHPGDIKKHARG